MTGRYYSVQIIYKAGFETLVYADNRTDAFARALADLEMSGDFIDVISNDVSEEMDANETRKHRG